MIYFKEIALDDKNIIRNFIQKDSMQISDISFGNLFIWRHARLIRYCILHECLVIETTYKNKDPFIFFPIGNGNKKQCILDLQEYYKSQNLKLEFHSLQSCHVEILNEIFSDINCVLNRDRSDYIYLTSNLINLSGRKYHKKKNHINRFFEEFSGFNFETIDENNCDELKNTFDTWFKNNANATNDIGLQNEHIGVIDALNNYQKLDFKGGLLRYNGVIMAFSFGEIMTENMCVIHIEKADINFKGAYQAINQQLLKHCFDGIEYVNREEDLGIPGLRKAKMSYCPDIILEKFETII